MFTVIIGISKQKDNLYIQQEHFFESLVSLHGDFDIYGFFDIQRDCLMEFGVLRCGTYEGARLLCCGRLDSSRNTLFSTATAS